MVHSSTAINVESQQERAQRLMKRRAVLLLIVACTQSNNEGLLYILNNGFLVDVKVWLDEILSFKTGGVDLLLHLLTSICMLPVTKVMVTSSKLGKQVAAVEKHKICVAGMNQKAIKERISKVKEEWSASVKRMKKKVSEIFCAIILSGMNQILTSRYHEKALSGATDQKILKRNLDVGHESSSVRKKMKMEPSAKSLSLSNLILQVSSPDTSLQSSSKVSSSTKPITSTTTSLSTATATSVEKVVLSRERSSMKESGCKVVDNKGKERSNELSLKCSAQISCVLGAS